MYIVCKTGSRNQVTVKLQDLSSQLFVMDIKRLSISVHHLCMTCDQHPCSTSHITQIQVIRKIAHHKQAREPCDGKLGNYLLCSEIYKAKLLSITRSTSLEEGWTSVQKECSHLFAPASEFPAASVPPGLQHPWSTLSTPRTVPYA